MNQVNPVFRCKLSIKGILLRLTHIKSDPSQKQTHKSVHEHEYYNSLRNIPKINTLPQMKDEIDIVKLQVLPTCLTEPALFKRLHNDLGWEWGFKPKHREVHKTSRPQYLTCIETRAKTNETFDKILMAKREHNT